MGIPEPTAPSVQTYGNQLGPTVPKMHEKVSQLMDQLGLISQENDHLPSKIERIASSLEMQTEIKDQGMSMQVNILFRKVFGDVDKSARDDSMPPPYSPANEPPAAPATAANSMQPQQQQPSSMPGHAQPAGEANNVHVHVPEPILGKIDHADRTAKIVCPIAGHPAFDKGEYFHEVGCCCYYEDRKTGQYNPCNFIFFPVTLGCYLGTLCYQPCGILCARKFPYFGDCPFSWQRVSREFAHKHPDKVKTTVRMVLVPRGHRSRIILEHADALRQKEEVAMTLANHPGKAICKMYDSVKFFAGYSYIESTLGDAEKAVRIKFDGNYIWVDGQEMVFDVAFWQYTEGQPVNFVGNGPRGPAVAGGGRDWQVNQDGTISLKHDSKWVLGL